MSDAPNGRERRRFHRVPFDASARIDTAQGHSNCTLIDISLKGMLLKRPKELTVQSGDRAYCVLYLPGENAIEMDICVTHVNHDAFGCRWEHIDLDSLSHLKRLIELNLGAPELLQRELSQLG